MTQLFSAFHASFSEIGFIEFPIQFATFLIVVRLAHQTPILFNRSLWAMFFGLAGANLLAFLAINRGHIDEAKCDVIVACLFYLWFVAPAAYLRRRNFMFVNIGPKHPTSVMWGTLYLATYVLIAMIVICQSIKGRYFDAATNGLLITFLVYPVLIIVCAARITKINSAGDSLSKAETK